MYCIVWMYCTLVALQSQDEVCDLKHAAPFQNIIPKPFVDYKGDR